MLIDKDYNPFKHIHGRLDIMELHLNDIKKKLDIPLPQVNLTRRMVKEQYHISYGTIHNHMKSGKLKYFKLGSKTLFSRREVELFLTKQSLK
jgi:hypothetical protein